LKVKLAKIFKLYWCIHLHIILKVKLAKNLNSIDVFIFVSFDNTYTDHICEKLWNFQKQNSTISYYVISCFS